MKLNASDPDVKTIANRILDKDIDLQPSFQRNEVWSENKKRRLIDSILRQWHVPPIHVVEVEESAKTEVLDGQQRLVAIRDFIRGDIKVDGYTKPLNKEIEAIDGLKYDELPPFWRRKFDQFPIRIFTITDYLPEEPGELFFRLNQPTNLTSAEQRNAFFGPARQQVKDIVNSFELMNVSAKALGFSNSRMAYDDVISKFCYAVERNSLLDKITANTITDLYRSEKAFSSATIKKVENSINIFGLMSLNLSPFVKFNKATLYSWLCFISSVESSSLEAIDTDRVGVFVDRFENLRTDIKWLSSSLFAHGSIAGTSETDNSLLEMFNDRASSRVSDVTSVITRDIVIWSMYYRFGSQYGFDSISMNEKFSIMNENKSLILNDYLGAEETFSLINELSSRYRWGKTV